MGKTIDIDTLKLLNLVIANRADEAIEIMENKQFDDGILTDILQYSRFGNWPSCGKLPLYLITLANEIYFGTDDFRDEIMPTVNRNREGINQLKEYWKAKGYPTDKDVDFSAYKELVAHFDDIDGDDYDYLLDGELEDLIKMGYDENEAKFCYALLTYDKPEIDKQISLGTNPNVWISGDVTPDKCNYANGMNGFESSFDARSDAQICYGVWHYWDSNKGDNLINAEWTTIRGLLSAAAYEQIIPLLERLAK